MDAAVRTVIDMHTHVVWGDEAAQAGWPDGPDELLRLADESSVSQVAAIVMAQPGEVPKTAERNDMVLAAGHADERLLPVCSVHPFGGEDALSEIGRVAESGARMLKLHPNTQRFDVADARVADVVAKAGDVGLPVLFDAYSPFDPAQVGKFVELAMRVPTADLVLAHMNGPGFPQMLVFETLAMYPWWRRRVWFDLSATVTMLAGGPFAEQFAWVIRKIGVDRVMFGSDWPLATPGDALAAFDTLGFDEHEAEQILSGNACSLLRLRE